MKTLPYCLSDSKVNMTRPRFEISSDNQMFEVNKLFFTCMLLFALFFASPVLGL